MLKILSPQLLGLWRSVNHEAGNQCPCKRAPLKSFLILCSACEDHGECPVWEAVEVYFQLHISLLVTHILRLMGKTFKFCISAVICILSNVFLQSRILQMCDAIDFSHVFTKWIVQKIGAMFYVVAWSSTFLIQVKSPLIRCQWDLCLYFMGLMIRCISP